MMRALRDIFRRRATLAVPASEISRFYARLAYFESCCHDDIEIASRGEYAADSHDAHTAAVAKIALMNKIVAELPPTIVKHRAACLALAEAERLEAEAREARLRAAT